MDYKNNPSELSRIENSSPRAGEETFWRKSEKGQRLTVMQKNLRIGREQERNFGLSGRILAR